MFADPVGFGEDDREAGHDIAQDALQGKAHPQAGHAEPGDQRRDLQAELIQRDEKPEDHHEGLHQTQQQQTEWWLQVLLVQPAFEEPPHRFGDEQGGHDDQDRPHDSKAVLHDVLSDQIGQRHASSPQLLPPEEPLQEVLALLFEIVRFRGTFQEVSHGAFDLFLHLLFDFSCKHFCVEPIGRGLRAAGNEQRQRETPAGQCDSGNGRAGRNLLAQGLGQIQIQFHVERLIEADRPAAGGLKIMAVDEKPLDGDQPLFDRKVAFDGGKCGGFDVV